MESHLLQMRGLKLPPSLDFWINNVASFTDAWIETSFPMRRTITKSGRIFYRCVD